MTGLLQFFGIGRKDPTVVDNQVICSNCKYHRPVPAGWLFDYCTLPAAARSVVEANGRIIYSKFSTCAQMRASSERCGPSGRSFVAASRAGDNIRRDGL